MPRSIHRFSPIAGWVALAGAVLAHGAPAGWFLLERVGPAAPRSALLYAYLFLSPLVVMTAAAALLGDALDRARQRAAQLEEANQRYQELATTDPLTGLRNRRYFQDRLREECARGDRTDQPLSLIMMDLDHFKAVNDAWGHPTGDAVLRHAARLLAGSVRSCDVACRVGGEEFAVLCPGAREEEALRIAERIRRALERTPLVVKGGEVSITGSLGVALREPDGGTEDLVREADLALYRAKAAGRNRVEAVPEETMPPPPRPSSAAPH
ncbi:MAG TPA: GGDEF domain-containing protein [Myxococcales bacterium]|nr:GGDEF domain-containing protein [Myxococcales bacterium]